MTIASETATLDATAMAELVRKKEATPLELVDAAIERIEKVNPKINAVVRPMYDIARTQAKGKLPSGPFTGVPYLLKDLLAGYAGVPMTASSKFMQDYVPAHDSDLVTKLKQAGLIVVGKTNTPEFGLAPTTEAKLFGPCRNPWDTARITGGSSGGSAAAVASGMLPAAHGNDGGGSIRIPAACCGVFGLKPTRGRISLGPDLGDLANGLVCEHALTRSVRDSAALLDATAGPSLGEPYICPPPARPYLQEVGANPGKLRIVFSAEAVTGTPVHEDCKKAVRETAKLCEELGHHVEERTPNVDADQFTQAFIVVFSVSGAWSIDAVAHQLGKTVSKDLFEPGTWAMYEMANSYSGSMYLLAWTAIQQASRLLAQFMEPYDLWLTPTTGEPPLKLGELDSPPDNPLHGLFRAAQFVPFTPICNATGQPAMSVPLCWNAQGLPIGSHFIGKYGDEATLFRLAAQLEQARPWAHRRPPVFAC